MEKLARVSTKSLNRLNTIAGFFHLGQLIAVIALANSFALPVTARYMSGPPGSTFGETTILFNIRTGVAVAIFLAISAGFHFLIVSPLFNDRYIASLRLNRNFFRWVEYSISSSVMIFVIAQICGIADIVSLLALVGVNASMILFGWLQEKYEQPGSGGWLPYIFGCVAGAVPWIAIAIYVIAPGNPSEASPPGFVYGIVISLFLFFNSFALVQWLQYKRVGKWNDYLVGERSYIVLSLAAKSVLAWQIFAGTLVG
ncbi:MAG: heliorhodopsin HeR [Actinobacteria bacterium]|nr:heliorhodopsin HeR [Actinomycetota bacterium]